MQRHLEVSDVQRYGCKALENLAARNGKKKKNRCHFSYVKLLPTCVKVYRIIIKGPNFSQLIDKILFLEKDSVWVACHDDSCARV